jgi:hypothetical protein
MTRLCFNCGHQQPQMKWKCELYGTTGKHLEGGYRGLFLAMTPELAGKDRIAGSNLIQT